MVEPECKDCWKLEGRVIALETALRNIEGLVCELGLRPIPKPGIDGKLARTIFEIIDGVLAAHPSTSKGAP